MRLSIKNVVMSDAGIYYCRANNSVGEDYQDFKVNVAAGRRRNPGMGSSSLPDLKSYLPSFVKFNQIYNRLLAY